MKLHPRETRCSKAELELSAAIAEIFPRHDLTAAETLRVINEVCSRSLERLIRLAIRLERHGDEDKQGGLA